MSGAWISFSVRGDWGSHQCIVTPLDVAPGGLAGRRPGAFTPRG